MNAQLMRRCGDIEQRVAELGRGVAQSILIAMNTLRRERRVGEEATKS